MARSWATAASALPGSAEDYAAMSPAQAEAAEAEVAALHAHAAAALRLARGVRRAKRRRAAAQAGTRLLASSLYLFLAAAQLAAAVFGVRSLLNAALARGYAAAGTAAGAAVALRATGAGASRPGK
jgi:hypothetical protein